MAIDLIHIPEWGVITGYADNGDTLYCRTYLDEFEGNSYAAAERIPWFFITLKKNNKKIEERDALLNSIRVFKSMMHIPWFGVYSNGYNAYDIWAAELVDDKMNTLPKHLLARKASVNTFCFDSLKDARISTALYLRKAIDLLKNDEQHLLLKVSDLYGEIVQKIEVLDSAGVLINIDSINSDKILWTEEMHRRTAEVLYEIKNIEKEIELHFDLLLHNHL